MTEFTIAHGSFGSYCLSETELDVMREISNIGAGNAATALAELLADRITISVPTLQIINLNRIASIVGGAETEVVGIVLAIHGDIDGMILFLLEQRICNRLLGSLFALARQPKHDCDLLNLDELSISALMELGNIISGAYVSALSALLDLDIRVTPPAIAHDMAGAILSYPASVLGISGDQVMIVREDFDDGQDQLTCHLLIMPSPDSLDLIMKRLQVRHA